MTDTSWWWWWWWSYMSERDGYDLDHAVYSTCKATQSSWCGTRSFCKRFL